MDGFYNIKNYLCQKTYPLNLLKQKKFWVKLINTKIKEVTEEKTKSNIEKKEREILLEEALMKRQVQDFRII